MLGHQHICQSPSHTHTRHNITPAPDAFAYFALKLRVLCVRFSSRITTARSSVPPFPHKTKGPPGNRATLSYGRQLQRRQSHRNSLVQEYGRPPALSRNSFWKTYCTENKALTPVRVVSNPLRPSSAFHWDFAVSFRTFAQTAVGHSAVQGANSGTLPPSPPAYPSSCESSPAHHPGTLPAAPPPAPAPRTARQYSSIN
jgi:hypothetical protein